MSLTPQSARRRIDRYQQARWTEPLIFDLSEPCRTGIGVLGAPDNSLDDLPEGLQRGDAPDMPELSQVDVLRHYLRLSQQTLAAGLVADMGMATATVKYNPVVNEDLARSPKLTALHPLQDTSTVQGILEIAHRLELILAAVSGLSRFSFQPRAGSAAIYANAAIIRAYHESRGESEQRNEIITTVLSHPSDAAGPATAGFDIITLYPEENGYPSVEALRSVLSRRTAGLMLTNPDDTGIFNPHIKEMVRLVHEAGGLCAHDQANANGLMGIVRSGDIGFDLGHFNLHKTFSTPHASGGPATGAMGVTAELAPFLPVPTIERDGAGLRLDYQRPLSVGKVGAFYGVAANLVRAYAWVMAHGPDGLRLAAETAVLNNNYLLSRLLAIEGISAPFGGAHRIEQVRYSWQEIADETGVSIDDLARRAADFGLHFFLSHHPFVIPSPATVEPTESYSLADLDEHAEAWAHLAEEARTNPDVLFEAPHRSAGLDFDRSVLSDPDRWAITWRAYRRKHRNP